MTAVTNYQILDAIEAADRARERRGEQAAEQRLAAVRADIVRAIAAGQPVSGMHVQYRGPLSRVVHLPSVQRDLREWLRMIDAD